MMKLFFSLHRNSVYISNFRNLSTAIKLLCTKTSEASETPIFDVPEDKILKKRNKSGLSAYYYNLENGIPNDPERFIFRHKNSLKKIYGLHGRGSGIDPGVCWPTQEEVATRIEKENILYPNSLQEMIEIERQKQEDATSAIEKRKEQVLKSFKEVEEWKKKIEIKTKKKEEIYKQQQAKREQTLEEVREFFGYRIDPRDPRFKEMVERKEEEEKKKRKQEKKLEKQAKMLAKIAQMAESSLKELETHKAKEAEAKVEDKT